MSQLLFLREWVFESNDALGVSLDEGTRVGLELQLNPVPIPALVVEEAVRVSVPSDYPYEDSRKNDEMRSRVSKRGVMVLKKEARCSML